MPRLRKNEGDEKNAALRELILVVQSRVGGGISGKALSNIIGCASATGLRRIKDPENLTIKELRKIRKSCRMPIEEMLEYMGRTL